MKTVHCLVNFYCWEMDCKLKNNNNTDCFIDKFLINFRNSQNTIGKKNIALNHPSLLVCLIINSVHNSYCRSQSSVGSPAVMMLYFKISVQGSVISDLSSNHVPSPVTLHTPAWMFVLGCLWNEVENCMYDVSYPLCCLYVPFFCFINIYIANICFMSRNYSVNTASSVIL